MPEKIACLRSQMFRNPLPFPAFPRLLQISVEAGVESPRESYVRVLQRTIRLAVRPGAPHLPQELGEPRPGARFTLEHDSATVLVDDHEAAHNIESAVVRRLPLLSETDVVRASSVCVCVCARQGKWRGR